MPKKRHGASGRKGGRFRPAAGTSPSDLSKYTPKNAGSGRQQPHRGGADVSETGTSMQQLALNTRNRAAHWDQGSRLRDRPVKFVSGGFVEPLTERELSSKPATIETQPNAVSSNNARELGAVIDVDTESAMTKALPLPQPALPDELSALHGTIDVDSDSSDDIILFRGRAVLELPKTPVVTEPPPGNETEPRESPAQVQPTGPTKDLPGSPATPEHLGLLLVNSDDDAGDDAALDDYVANMNDDDMADMINQLALNRRDLGGLHNGVVIDTTSDNEYDNSNDQCDGASDALSEEEQSDEDNGESEDDDLNCAEEMTADVDDEQLARLLAKQEELGLDADELILFDDASVRNTGSAKQSSQPGKQPKRPREAIHGRHQGHKLTRGLRTLDGSYPSASAVADAFEQLEVSGSASRRGGFRFDVSDSEMEATLQASWQKDRMKKKDRKRAREELRARGMLGKHAKPDDPRAKYPNGMDLNDVKAEFQSFLLGSGNSVALSPMDASARKAIHELAYRFNITSKSVGSGDQRRPTLVRTKSTAQFNEEQFHSVFARYRYRFFARLDKNPGAAKKAAGHQRGGPAAATVRNGEVVGGSAPEIGQANKGRTMLERMGWSRGMALGALDNQGMTQPIAHIVRRSKAGLG